MELIFSLLLCTLLLVGTSSVRVNQDVDRLKHPSLHLPLYHVLGRDPDSLQTSDSAISFSDLLALDDARVKFLNSRLNKRNLTAVVTSNGLIEGNSITAPLNSAVPLGVANYYTKIGVGTPPTYYPVVVDTGSSLSWIQCQPCLVYCHPQAAPLFDPSASRTYQTLSCETNDCSSLKGATGNNPMCTSSDQCVYYALYGDQSFSKGFLSKDSLTFGSETLSSFVFGCGQNNDGIFGKSAGLVGFAKSPLSMLSQLSTKYGKKFSYCLPSLGKSGSGGYLSIGTTSSSSASSFTPMLSNSREPSLYFLKLSAITVSGKPLSVAAAAYGVPTIVDSGTTLSRLSAPVYGALKDELVKIISSKYKVTDSSAVCFAGTAAEVSTVVPAVEMRFEGGAVLKLAPQNVVLELESGRTCLSMAANSNPHDIAIIGNQQQQTIEVVYDLANSRIGFGAGGCR